MADFLLGGQLDPATHQRTAATTLVASGDLTTHGVIVGMTGSGKTGLGIVLIEEALRAGVPTLLIDPKGDLTNRGRAGEWRTYAGLVDALPVPVDGLPGNHDLGPDDAFDAITPRQAADAFGLSIALPLTVRDLPGLRLILISDETAGCVGFRICESEIKIDSFYLARHHHNRGLGAAILKVLLAEADALGLPVQLDVLHGSPADRFYQRHGFVKLDQDDIEAHYERAVGATPA